MLWLWKSWHPCLYLGRDLVLLGPQPRSDFSCQKVRNALLTAMARRKGRAMHVVNTSSTQPSYNSPVGKLKQTSRVLQNVLIADLEERLKDRWGFLNPRTNDILSWIVLFCGDCPEHWSSWAASLPSTHQKPAATLSCHDSQKCLWTLSNALWGPELLLAENHWDRLIDSKEESSSSQRRQQLKGRWFYMEDALNVLWEKDSKVDKNQMSLVTPDKGLLQICNEMGIKRERRPFHSERLYRHIMRAN